MCHFLVDELYPNLCGISLASILYMIVKFLKIKDILKRSLNLNIQKDISRKFNFSQKQEFIEIADSITKKDFSDFVELNIPLILSSENL